MNPIYTNSEPVPIINIIGMGVRGRKQLTLESIKTIKGSSFILFFSMEKSLQEWLSNTLEISQSESLDALYKHGDIDKENYKRISNKITNMGEKYRNISVLVPGHPYIGVTWIRELDELAKKNLIHINVLEGISSFDTMINDLKVDPLDHGSTIVDANRLLLFQLKIETKIDLYIYHVCSIGNSRTDYNQVSLRNNLKLLQSYLSKFYALDQKIILIGSTHIASDGLMLSCMLSDLYTFESEITVATSLFIPGLETSKKDIDEKFYEILKAT